MNLPQALSSTTRIALVASLASVLAHSGITAPAQNQVWIDQIGTSGGEGAQVAASDGSGGVFLSGYTSGSLGGPSAGLADAWLARYDGAGNQLWINQFGTAGSDDARAATPDGAGGVYLSGYTNGNLGGQSMGSTDAWLARYDSTGSQLWTRQLGTTSNESALASAMDNAGGAYVSGYTEGNLAGPNVGFGDAWIARYDSAGNQAWIRQLGSSTDDYAFASAIDSAGGVHVCGYTRGNLAGPNAGGFDVWMARFDSAGNQVWIRQLGTSGNDSATAAAPDGAGGVYLSGQTDGTFGGPNAGLADAWLARFDSAGNQLWMRQLGTSGQDYATASALDGLGGVYVTGYTQGGLGGPSSGGGDTWLARYDGAGNKLWIVQLGTSDQDYGAAAATDQAGGVFVSGWSAGSLGGPNAGGEDAWVAHYDPCSALIYCVGAINSTGQAASIGYLGSTSIGQNDLVLTATACPPSQVGIFFFGLFQTQAPFGDGWLCVTGGQNRLLPAVALNSSGVGSLQVDFTDPNSPASMIPAGSVRNFQFWYRDPQLVGNGFNLSNGLSAQFCP